MLRPSPLAFAFAACVRSTNSTGRTCSIRRLLSTRFCGRIRPARTREMEFESRNLYREKVVKIAEHSDSTEMEVALRSAGAGPQRRTAEVRRSRACNRESHVGYYLIGRRSTRNCMRAIRFRPSLVRRIRALLTKPSGRVLLPGIEILTFGIMSAVVLLLTSTYHAAG